MENGQTDAAGTTNAQSVPVGFINEDGTFKDGWTGNLDEDIRGEKCLQSLKDIKGAMRTYVNAQKMVGKDKIVKPSEASSQAEWDAYYSAGGRPATAADYGFKKPDDYPDDIFDETYAKEVQDLLYKHGASKKLANALFQHNLQYVAKLVKSLETDEQLDMEGLKNGLRTEWGSAYEQKVHLGNVAIEHGSNGNEEFKQRLTSKLGNDPDFIRFAANVGSKFAEAGAFKPELIPTPSDIQERINTEIAHPAYGIDYVKHGFTKQQHDTQVQKVQRLFEEKHKSIKGG